MYRIILFILSVMLGVGIVLWLMRHPGTLEVDWLNYHLQMPIALFFGGLLLVFLAGLLLLKILRTLWLIPRRLCRCYSFYDRKRADKGLMAALSAYENENTHQAAEMLKPALHNSETRPIATFFAALMAQKQEKFSEAHARFRELTRLSGGESLGYKGLIALERRRGGVYEAEDYARQALPHIAYAPKLGIEVFDTFLTCELMNDAAQTLEKMSRLRLLPEKTLKTLESKLAVARSKTALASHEFERALYEAKKAYEACPALEQGLAYADLLIAQDCSGQARKLLEKIWQKMPDSKIIDVYLQTYGPLEPFAKYQLVETLTQKNASHPESLAARIRAAMDAALWGIARSDLEKYQESCPESPCFLMLMADYEQQANHDPAAALKWLKKLKTESILEAPVR